MCPNSTASNSNGVHSKKMNKNNQNDDPHNIEERFVQNHKTHFEKALKELHNGQKRSCWSWFMLPTQPFIVNGVERGSEMNRYYALRGDAAVEAFLNFKTRTTYDNQPNKPIDLRANYLAIVLACRQQLLNGKTLKQLLGELDVGKAEASFKLFARIAGHYGRDMELFQACRDVLDLHEGKPLRGVNDKKKKKRRFKMVGFKSLLLKKKRSRPGE